MTIKPIRTEADLLAALTEVDQLAQGDPLPGTAAGDKLEILLTLIEDFEGRHYPVALPDPIEAIKFRMEQGSLSVADLTDSIGNPNRVYEILNRKRPLTLRMIRNLHSNLGIPLASLVPAGPSVKAATPTATPKHTARRRA